MSDVGHSRLTYDSEGTLYPVGRFTAVSKNDEYL